jgi:tetratricopeptide (TPR) repeat protein
MNRTVATLLAASLLASSADAQAASLSSARPAMRLLAPAAGAATTAAATTGAASAAPAAPSETETFESLVGQATGKFKEKDYAGAVQLFERAYAVQPEPAILFNIGRIYEEAQNAEAAIGYYEKFIADEGVEAKDQEKAVQRLTVLRTIVEIREKEKARNQPKPAEPTPVANPNPVNPPQPPVNQAGDQKPAKPGRLMRPIGYTLLGTGAALLIGGGVAGGFARAQYTDFADAKSLSDREAAATRGGSLARTADGLFIAGGVVAVIGVVLLIIPAVRKSRAAQALSPQVSPTQVGLGFTHQF